MTWRGTRPAIAAVLAITLATVGVAAWRWWHNHPPYGPEALAITSSLRFVGNEEAQAAIGGTHAPWASERDQLVLGRVSWQAPPEPLDGSYFVVFLIDKRTNHKPHAFGVPPSQEMAVSLGSAGTDNRIAERYPWLRGAGDVKVSDNEWRSNGNRLGVTDEKASPLTFVALFPYVEQPDRQPRTASAPVEMSDLLLALVYMGPDGQVYWAERLQG